MDNDIVKSHESTITTGKNTENKLMLSQFFENQENCRWLSSKDVSYLLSITENALRIMVCRNQIKAYKFGRRLRFRYADCVSLLRMKGTTDVY